MTELTLDYTEKLTQELVNNNVHWIFGYGSLIWKVDFEIDQSVPGFITGFKRRFWLASEDHRGTPDSPGRVLSLYESEPDCLDEKVYGVAYKINEEKRMDILRHLAFRE